MKRHFEGKTVWVSSFSSTQSQSKLSIKFPFSSEINSHRSLQKEGEKSFLSSLWQEEAKREQEALSAVGFVIHGYTITQG